MSATPLSHHRVLGLVGPFAAHDRHVDLAASDRTARALVFRPVHHAGEPALEERLRLDCADTGHYRVTRTLVHASELQATLQVDAADPVEAVARIMAVPPASQFPRRGGVLVAESLAGGFAPPRASPAHAPPDSNCSTLRRWCTAFACGCRRPGEPASWGNCGWKPYAHSARPVICWRCWVARVGRCTPTRAAGDPPSA